MFGRERKNQENKIVRRANEDPVIKKKIRSSMGGRLLRIAKETCGKEGKKKKKGCLSRDSNAVLLLS